MQHDAHARAFWDYIMAEILACLQPTEAAIAAHGWQDWSRYAAQGEW